MALSGSQSVTVPWNKQVTDLNNTNEKITYTLEWRVTSQNAIDNTSTIEFKLYGTSYCDCYFNNYGDWSNMTFRRFNLVLNGDTYVIRHAGPGLTGGMYTLENTYYQANVKTHLYTASYIYQHNSVDDQVFTYKWSASYDDSATNNEGLWITDSFISPVNVSSSGVIDHIVRSAFLESILDGLRTCTDEDPLNILYTNPMGNEAVSLQAGISVSNGAAMEVPYRNISKTGTVYKFNLTTSEWKAIYAKTLDKKIESCTIRFYLKSTVPVLDGNSTETRISTMEGTMSFINFLPYMNNPTLKDVNPITTNLTGNPDIFVRYASKIQYDLKAVTRKQATLGLTYCANGDTTVNGATGVLDGVNGDDDKADFFLQIFDSRGYFDAVQKTYSVIAGNYIPYIRLTCAVKNGLLDANGNLLVTITGKYYAGSFGSIKNSLTLKYNIRKNGEIDNWQYVSNTSNIQVDSKGNYTHTFTIKNLDYTDRYLLTVCATDQINQEGSTTETIIGAVPVFDWGKNDFAFYVPVTINGANVPSIVEQDKSGIWTYRKWSDGNAECWGKVSFNTTVTTALGSLYTSGARSEANVTFPFEFAEIPVVTATMDSKQAACWLIASANTAASDKTSTTSTGRYEIVRPTTLSNGAFTINYYVRGRWE